MKTTRIVRTLLVPIMAMAGVVLVAHPSHGSVVASVAITSPEAGASLTGDTNVQAQAYGTVDPPQKIQFFVDDHTKPSATVDCLINLSYGGSYCGGQWLWHSSQLVGRHSLSAKVILLDGVISDVSAKVHVVISSQTEIKVQHAKHPSAGRRMSISGRVRSLAKGHPGARRMQVTVTASPAFGRGHTLHLRTNTHGYYHAKIRAIANTSVTVMATGTRRYVAPQQATYVQYVRGHPHCGLSRKHVAVKHTTILRCHFSHLGYGFRYQVQGKVHGKWRHARTFTSSLNDRTKLFITPVKARTMRLREVFPRNNVFGRSISNPVTIHVS